MADLKEFELTEEETAQLEKGEIETPDETPPEEKPPEEVIESPEQKPPEQKPAEKPKDTEEKEKQVPLAALHEARNEIKKLKERLGVVDELKVQIEAMRGKKAPEELPAEPISWDNDPLGHTRQRLDSFETLQSEAKKTLENLQQIQSRQQFAVHVSNLENEFRRSAPDYDEAFQYLKGIRLKELNALGITDEKQINEEIQRNAIGAAFAAIQSGRNPAQSIYEIAQAYGYKKAAEKAKDDTLETVTKGQEEAANKMKGGEITTPVNVQALVDAEGEEFDRLWKEFFK